MNEYRQHWWKCDGPCQHNPPYYGIVKRAMNRPPSSKDSWWSKHQTACGGTYVKIKEPDDYKKNGKTSGEDSKTSQGKNANIKKLLEKNSSDPGSSNVKQSPQKADAKFCGEGHVLGGIKQDNLSKQFSRPSEAAAFAAQKRRSLTTDPPINKRMRESSEGKVKHKEIVKATKTSVSPSKAVTSSKDIRDLLRKGTKYSKATTNSIKDSGPCSSSSIVVQDPGDEDVIDLTSDNACPICGFTSQRADRLSTHIDECLVTFAS